MTKKLRCPYCKSLLTYLVVRSQFYIKDGKPTYTNGTAFKCPFCDNGIAGDEKLAVERLTEGYRQ